MDIYLIKDSENLYFSRSLNKEKWINNKELAYTYTLEEAKQMFEFLSRIKQDLSIENYKTSEVIIKN
jgi:hypothetical protein